VYVADVVLILFVSCHFKQTFAKILIFDLFENIGIECAINLKVKIDKMYLHGFTFVRNVNTKVTYNSSDCPNASDLHKNPNLTQSINNQLANSDQLSSHMIYNGKTTGLGRSYHVPLIGYVYTTNRRGIKDAIKRAWSNAGTKYWIIYTIS
jgi:hypothetical protein